MATDDCKGMGGGVDWDTAGAAANSKTPLAPIRPALSIIGFTPLKVWRPSIMMSLSSIQGGFTVNRANVGRVQPRGNWKRSCLPQRSRQKPLHKHLEKP